MEKDSLMKFLKACARFWCDFMIGDDYKIAVSVAGALFITVAARRLFALGEPSTVAIGALLLIAGFSINLFVDARSKR